MAEGMKSMRLHKAEPEASIVAKSTQGSGRHYIGVEALDPETAARRYLNSIINSDSATIAAAPTKSKTEAEYKNLGIDRIPFTGNQFVKFRQYFHKIPVYGSLVTVELDSDNGFVSVNTTLGDPSNVDPVAKLSPEEVLKKVSEWAGYGDKAVSLPARLFFYYDAGVGQWRLVYVVEDVPRLKPKATGKADSLTSLPEVSDFVVDAHGGELVAELPRTQTMAEVDGREDAVDGLGMTREIYVVIDDVSNQKQLHDRARNVLTHDFGFKDAYFLQASLPGNLVTNPPGPWDAGSISAHANAQAVVDFLRDVLQRDGLDGAGGRVISSVNCVYGGNGQSKEWRNAARFRGQMIC